MTGLEELRRRIETLDDLADIARSMKILAASNIRHFERAARALAEHVDLVALAFRAALFDAPAGSMTARPNAGAPAALVLFGSDRGLCGRFDETVAVHVAERLRAGRRSRGPHPTLVVGRRLLERVRTFDELAIESVLATPGGLQGVVPLVDTLIAACEAWQARGIEQIELIHQRRDPVGAEASPVTIQLVPVPAEIATPRTGPRWPGRGLPSFRGDRVSLLRELAWSWLFGGLQRAILESLEAETLGRLATMQAAEHNLDERRGELERAFRQQRQAAITAELFDVWQGARAAGSGPPRD